MSKLKKVRITAKVYTSGGNLVITIPKPIAKKMDITKDDHVEAELTRVE